MDEQEQKLVADSGGWLALGLSLRLVLDGGRSTPVNFYSPLQYRPNWGLASMSGTEQVGAPVLCGWPTRLAPGEQGRVVIIPAFPASLRLWHTVRIGHEIRMFEGPTVCAIGKVRCVRTVDSQPVSDDQATFRAWTMKANSSGQPDPL